MAEPTITPGGLARDAAGNLADMPRDMVHGISHELFDVLTLLHSSAHEVEAAGDQTDDDTSGLMTSAESRASALISMAGDKVRPMLAKISPYV